MLVSGKLFMLKRIAQPFSDTGEKDLARVKLLHYSCNWGLTLGWMIEGDESDDVL